MVRVQLLPVISARSRNVSFCFRPRKQNLARRTAAVHMAARHMQRGPSRTMAGLVVEEEVGLELTQKFALRQAAPGNIASSTPDVPVHQREDRAFVRRCAARGDECGANPHVRIARPAAAGAARASSGLNGPPGSGSAAFSDSCCTNASSPCAWKHQLGLIGEQHRNRRRTRLRTSFGPGVARMHRFDQHARCRKAREQCGPHIRPRFADRKQMGTERPQITEWRAAPA